IQLGDVEKKLDLILKLVCEEKQDRVQLQPSLPELPASSLAKLPAIPAVYASASSTSAEGARSSISQKIGPDQTSPATQVIAASLDRIQPTLLAIRSTGPISPPSQQSDLPLYQSSSSSVPNSASPTYFNFTNCMSLEAHSASVCSEDSGGTADAAKVPDEREPVKMASQASSLGLRQQIANCGQLNLKATALEAKSLTTSEQTNPEVGNTGKSLLSLTVL
ncbi:unnamed protein product, partial [Protopolystoma xenopodis]